VSRESRAPYLWMLAGCFSFAWMAEFSHQVAQTCDWRLAAVARSALVLLFAAALAVASRARLVVWRPRVLWLRSIAGSISLVLTFYAFKHLRPTEVLTLTNTFPIWVAVLSWPMLREAPPASVWVAAGCGVLGIYLIQRPSFDAANVAIALALAAAMTSAIAMLGLHQVQGVDPRAIVVHFAGVATLVTAVCCLLGERPVDLSEALPANNLLLLLGVGVTATLGQLALTQAFTAGPPAKVSVVGLSQVVFVLVLDLLVTDTTFSPRTLCGIGLVLAPSAWMMAGRAAG
jgi:drug/metabolite transporter (DMT)-like permease